MEFGMASFDILHLFPDFFQPGLEIYHALGDFRHPGLGSDGIDLALNLLDEKV